MDWVQKLWFVFTWLWITLQSKTMLLIYQIAKFIAVTASEDIAEFIFTPIRYFSVPIYKEPNVNSRIIPTNCKIGDVDCSNTLMPLLRMQYLMQGDMLLSEIIEYCRERSISSHQIIIHGIVSEPYPSFQNATVRIMINRDESMVKITKTRTVPSYEVTEFINPIMFNVINLSTLTLQPMLDPANDLDQLLQEIEDL